MPAAAQQALIHALLEWPVDALQISPREKALVSYSDKLTLTPARIGTADIALLKAEGLDDRAIHDLCAIVAYYAFVNRIADGLGVELEDGM